MAYTNNVEWSPVDENFSVITRQHVAGTQSSADKINHGASVIPKLNLMKLVPIKTFLNQSGYRVIPLM